MELTKTIYQDNKIINTFEISGENASAELVNALLNKIDGKYRVRILKDPASQQIKIDLYFNSFNKKYRYNYLFKNVNNLIDLH